MYVFFDHMYTRKQELIDQLLDWFWLIFMLILNVCTLIWYVLYGMICCVIWFGMYYLVCIYVLYIYIFGLYYLVCIYVMYVYSFWLVLFGTYLCMHARRLSHNFLIHMLPYRCMIVISALSCCYYAEGLGKLAVIFFRSNKYWLLSSICFSVMLRSRMVPYKTKGIFPFLFTSLLLQLVFLNSIGAAVVNRYNWGNIPWSCN